MRSDIEVAAVVTNPDRPAGRKLEPRPPPVKLAAQRAGLDVLQPEKARDPSLAEHLERLHPDVATVVAYGKILPASLLAIPRRGFVNLHFSVLPAYRGAAPVQRALMDGVSETGASIMVLTEGMDEGPVLATETVTVESEETAGELGRRLASVGAELLVPTLAAYVRGDLEPVAQDEAGATYASKPSPEEARIDWSAPAATIHNLVRALNPSPVAWTTLRGARLRVLRTRQAADEELGPAELAPDRAVVGAGGGALELVEVQPAGKRAMSGGDFVRGLRAAPGERFE